MTDSQGDSKVHKVNNMSQTITGSWLLTASMIRASAGQSGPPVKPLSSHKII